MALSGAGRFASSGTMSLAGAAGLFGPVPFAILVACCSASSVADETEAGDACALLEAEAEAEADLESGL